MRLHFNFSVVLPLFARVLRELERSHGLSGFSGFVYGRDSIRELRRLGVPTDDVVVLTDTLRQFGDREPDLDFLRDREQRYGEPNLYAMIAACRFVSTFERRRSLQILEGGIRSMEALFDRCKPSAVISDGVACTLSYIQYAIARARGIPYLTVAPARLNGRFYVIRNHRDRNERVDEYFQRFKREGLSADERERAEAFIQMFRATAAKPTAFVQLATVPGFDGESVRTLIDLARRYYLVDRDNYLTMPPHQAVWSRMVRVAKARVLDRPKFQQIVAGERFVFFPLHFQPELTTLVLAPFHVNQIATIENIAKTLPIDHVLYVKEHKASLGRRSAGYYDAIRRIPNARLLSPHLDSHDLIRRCSAVCVLSSTVGWEAILYEKPVVTLGDVFYNSFDLVEHVQSFDDLPAALDRACRRPTTNHELLVEYVAANFAGTFAGDVFHPPGAATSASLAPDNVRRVADVLAMEVGLTRELTRAQA